MLVWICSQIGFICCCFAPSTTLNAATLLRAKCDPPWQSVHIICFIPNWNWCDNKSWKILTVGVAKWCNQSSKERGENTKFSRSVHACLIFQQQLHFKCHWQIHKSFFSIATYFSTKESKNATHLGWKLVGVEKTVEKSCKDWDFSKCKNTRYSCCFFYWLQHDMKLAAKNSLSW